MDRRTALKTLALAGTAAASGGLGATGAFAQQTTELTFWTWRQEDRSQYAQLFGDFTKKNPDIKINFQGYEATNYGTVLSTALAAGKGPDVIHIRA
jgi:raffinose/stachyose/melibiose transport system substrate-binding protein